VTHPLVRKAWQVSAVSLANKACVVKSARKVRADSTALSVRKANRGYRASVARAVKLVAMASKVDLAQ
jgi:hypothetical protein